MNQKVLPHLGGNSTIEVGSAVAPIAAAHCQDDRHPRPVAGNDSGFDSQKREPPPPAMTASMRVALWTSPLAIALIYRVVIAESPALFTLVTTALVFLAAYPLALDRQHFLSQVYYYQAPKEVNWVAYLVVGIEVLFIALATYLFACDYFNEPEEQAWVALGFLYFTFGLLWMQTQGFSELKFGRRRFYFKTSLAVGLIYSALMTTAGYEDAERIWISFDVSRERVQEVYRYLNDIGLDDLMSPIETWTELTRKANAAKTETLHLRDLVVENEKLLHRAESGDFAAVLGLASKLTNLLISRLPEPLNFVMMIVINTNLVVGFMFSTHLLAIAWVYERRRIFVPSETQR